LPYRNWESVEEIVHDKKYKEITLEMKKMSDKVQDFTLRGDGEIIHNIHFQFIPYPTTILKIKLDKDSKNLELSSVNLSLGKTIKTKAQVHDRVLKSKDDQSYKHPQKIRN